MVVIPITKPRVHLGFAVKEKKSEINLLYGHYFIAEFVSADGIVHNISNLAVYQSLADWSIDINNVVVWIAFPSSEEFLFLLLSIG